MLLRHAKTETDAPSGRDQDRRLDDRGHKDAARMGDWIAAHPPFPDTVLVSHAVRARQTWDIAWEAMKDRVPAPQVEVLPELYGADPAQILDAIRTATAPADPKRLLADRPQSRHARGRAHADRRRRSRWRQGPRRQPAHSGACDLRL
ncbi:SixA phosphatase family protein [Bradyrhizobium yuanmingense]|uniref:SixA phosphatase family protein n=1 Tax=Bradyrhizobium yuanmingense TaxID=108015 RepID=UPI003512CD5A